MSDYDDVPAEVETELPEDITIEVEDDTPVEDRGRDPLPKEIVQELDGDELEEYSEKVKIRLKQMKKVYHDERREKERAYREQQEAVAVAKRIMDENKRLKSTLAEGETALLDTYKSAANLELEMAKQAYREAHELGDSDKIMDAQTKFNAASFKLQQLSAYKPSLQTVADDVHIPTPKSSIPTPDAKTIAWQERNPWWGTDPEMTSLALGFHQKLERENGKEFIGTDDYWNRVDKTMRTRFPEYFGSDTGTGGGKPSTRTDKPANVVAPASRSTSAKRIVLKQSQVDLAKRLGVTPEQYAKEFLKLENAHG